MTKRKTHVKSYTRRKHGKAKHGGRVSAHERGYEAGSDVKKVSRRVVTRPFTCDNCGRRMTAYEWRKYQGLCSECFGFTD